MSPRKNPWEEVPPPAKARYRRLAEAFCPAIRLKPFDLWVNLRILFRAAILKEGLRGRHVARVRTALHYIWDAPTAGKLRELRPGWAKATVERWHARFVEHVARWGPGDVEFVGLTLRRRPTAADLDLLAPSEFLVDEIGFRTGAHAGGVLEQALKGNWDKLGNIQVNYKVEEAPFEMQGRRPVLTVDSYHHSFFRPGEVSGGALVWPNVVVPRLLHFGTEEWGRFRIEEKERGAEAWELS